MLVEVGCDLCGSAGGEVLYPATIDPQAADPARYFSTGRELAGHLRIVRCETCGLVRSSPRDDEETLRRVYSRLADRAYEGEERNRQATSAEHLAFVQRHQPVRGRLLDVGCATGIFLAGAAVQGWRVSGLEPSSWSLSQARRRLPDVALHQGSVGDADLPAERYDVITLWDVLEHVASPVATLEQLQRWLQPGGWLFLNVPDVASWPARLMARRWVLLLREHLWYFSPSTMAGLLRRSGFEMTAARPNWVRFSLANVLLRLRQYPGLARGLAARLGRLGALGNLSIKFPMGEMTVAARKLASGGSGPGSTRSSRLPAFLPT